MITGASHGLSRLTILDPEGGRFASSSSNRLICRKPADLRIGQSFPVRNTKKSVCSLGLVSAAGSSQKQGQMFEPECNPDQTCRPTWKHLPDRWVEDCVFDIVRNIKEAPFLHLMFDSKGSTVRTQRRSVPKANGCAVDRWKEMKDSVTKTSPDGVILVRHLDVKAVGGCCVVDFSDELASSPANRRNDEEENGNGTDMWGVLVLGKGVARNACYILETTSVASTFGTCTRFCLTRAKCFGPSWQEQMQSSWLLGTDFQNPR